MQLSRFLRAIAPAVVLAAASEDHAPPWFSPDHWDDQLIVRTSNGPILGHLAPNRSSIVEYLGIPYAAPPVGELRFAAAQPYAGFGFKNASTWGFDCVATPSKASSFPGLTPQAQRILDYFGQGTNSTQDEDCLTLNVWTKQRRRRRDLRKHRRGRPVIALFYGGRFSLGTTNTPFYYGQFFADSQDVVVVTINFRSNIFGFPGIPGELQNLGLRDQRLAIEWIYRNVAAFGGDPSKIVIVGQSAGAVAVDYWSYAYREDPIVSGLISHSGTALSFPLNADGVVTRNWYNVSDQLGCGSSGDVLPCMRAQSCLAIKTAAASIRPTSGGGPLRATPAFYPVVDNITVFADYEALSNAGAFARLPYLLGNNNNEQGFYNLTAYATGMTATTAGGDAFLLSSFTCPSFFEASNRKRYGVPVWLWRYFGDWDNLRLYAGSGAYHGSDVDVLFGNDGQVSGIVPSPAEQETTAIMQRAWAAFANDPVHGLTELGYPEFDTASDSLIRFAYSNCPGASFVSPLTYAASCSNVTLAGA